MVHSAFDVKELLRNCPVKIDSIGLWRARLLVLCIDGSLRVYAADRTFPEELEEEPDVIKKSDTLQLHDTLIGFAKRPVSCMDVSPSKKLLITLSDAVTVHKLPGFDAVAYLTKTKGASLYAWDEKLGLLCAAKQKRLIVFQHDGGREFSEVKEIAAPDTVKSMAWCGDSLCLGIRREYVIMNITTGVCIDVFPCGRIASPLVVPLPNGELLLGKDNVGVFIDQNGKLTHPGGITWSEVPSFVVINAPYAVAKLSRFIEVRYLRSPHSLVQMLPLREMQLLPSSGYMTSSGPHVLVSSDTAVYGLLPVPLGVQIVQLAASRNFDEALALCKLLPAEEAALRAAKEDDIHIRYGHLLFERGEYTQAMEHFSVSSMDLTAILSLFPSVKLPSFVSMHTSGPFLEASASEASSDMAFTQASSEYVDSMDGNAQEPDQKEEVKENMSWYQEKQKNIAFNALAGFLMAKRVALVGKAQAEDTDAAVAAMVQHKCIGNASTDFRRAKVNSKYGETGIEMATEYGTRELAVILDTALVQAMLVSQQSSAAMELLQGPNYCDVNACEEMMLEGRHYRELLQLYKYNEMHQKVLNLLNHLAVESDSTSVSIEESQQHGPDAIIEYLKKLGGNDPLLILKSSAWLLKSYPVKAMNLFTSINPPLPADLVNGYIKEHAPELQAMYLENVMINDPKNLSSKLQNELVIAYLEKVLEERAELQSQGRWDERELTEVRKTFLAVLENATAYNSEDLLKRFPLDGLHEERAMVLGQMGQHQLALTLYAHKLHEPELALKYCDRVFLASISGLKNRELAGTVGKQTVDKGPANIYLSLLQLYLNPRSAIMEYDRSVRGLTSTRNAASQRVGSAHKTKGHVARKIAQIEGAEGMKQSLSSNESAAESGKSEGEDFVERANQNGGVQSENAMLDEALNLLRNRWDRIDNAQALRLLPSDTRLQLLLPFLEPLLRKSSEARRNLSVIRNLLRSENLQVRDELQKCRSRVVRVTSERTCSICHKRIGSSVFAVYPNGTLVHFVCYRDKSNRSSPPPAIKL
eukprot:c28613_g1_i1 orf=68-3187(+)